MNRKPTIEYYYRIGEVYGRLTLTGYSFFECYSDGKRRRLVEAICECGNIDKYVFDSIQRGDTRSCGCLQKDLLRKYPHNITHGLSKHPLFKVWLGMRERCSYDKHNRYYRYGGRGIKVCDEWVNNIKAFYNWAIANGWKKGLTVDRFPDQDGNYEPSNCRLVSQRAQRLNRDDLSLITAFGETKCAVDWSYDKRCKVKYGGLRNRLYRDKKNWPDVEKAITTPPQIRGKTIKYKPENRMIMAFGETKSMAEWLVDNRCVVDESTLKKRLNKGCDSEKILTTPKRKSPSIKNN